MKFKLTVKRGLDVIAEIESVAHTRIYMDELRKVIETEQFLERLFGYRFHIDSKLERPRKFNGSSKKKGGD